MLKKIKVFFLYFEIHWLYWLCKTSQEACHLKLCQSFWCVLQISSFPFFSFFLKWYIFSSKYCFVWNNFGSVCEDLDSCSAFPCLSFSMLQFHFVKWRIENREFKIGWGEAVSGVINTATGQLVAESEVGKERDKRHRDTIEELKEELNVMRKELQNEVAVGRSTNFSPLQIQFYLEDMSSDILMKSTIVSK